MPVYYGAGTPIEPGAFPSMLAIGDSWFCYPLPAERHPHVFIHCYAYAPPNGKGASFAGIPLAPERVTVNRFISGLSASSAVHSAIPAFRRTGIVSTRHTSEHPRQVARGRECRCIEKECRPCMNETKQSCFPQSPSCSPP